MSKKQTICLNMIVKNESHIIEELLNSVYKYIDYYVINDTGSTDGTQEKIKKFFDSKNIKGEIINHEFRTCKCHNEKYKKYDWFHFGWNRTYALNKCIGKSNYILIMDADDILVGELSLPDKMDKDYYNLRIGNSYVYYRPQLIKNDKKLKWKYIGGLHEYLNKSNIHKGINLEGNYYIDSRRLGDRSKEKDKYLKDAKIFEELLKEEPLNERYMFYCAQSYYDYGDYNNAIKYYVKRILRHGFIEEVYYSLFKIAQCKQILKYSMNEIIQAYNKCYRYYPIRAEPLYELAKYYRINNKFDEAYNYCKKALLIPYPKNDVLFVDKDVYDYKLEDEISMCAYNLGKYNEAYTVSKNILEKGKYPLYEKIRLHINYMNFKKQLKEKPILCFYIGYVPDYTKTEEGVYGSELALKNISELLVKYYDVYIFGTSFEETKIYNNVNYMNSNLLHDFGKNNEIDIMIISRYIHYFMDFNIMARKTYIWIHDTLLQPYWNGIELPYRGKFLLENIINKIDGIITLCECHKQLFLKYNDIDPNKIYIIGNGINPNDFNHKVEKVKNRFIWMSNPNRGLLKLINNFHTIRKLIPDAELYVYRGIEEFNDKIIIEEINKYDYIKFNGKLPNKDLIPEIMKSEYWYYPTDFYETYCISALEAQMSGCICITSNVGALAETVSDRGIIIDKSVNTEDYWNKALLSILAINNDAELKQSYIYKAINWAKEQSWENRLNEWLKLFGK